ncbi:MAG: alkaline phosphatase family protein [Candidatus Acidiferrales bacterium]
MRRGLAALFLILPIVAFAVVARPRSSQSGAPGPIQHVIVITIDGMKPQTYTEPDAHGLKVPTLRELVRHGASSDGVLPVMPSVTYPSHTTMVTGVNPGTHGIVTNPAWDPFQQNSGGYRWYEEDIKVPTLWQLAHRRGLRTALIHWPVTVGAQADINVPEYWRANIPEDLKLLRALSTPGVLGDVASESPDFFASMTPEPADSALTDIATYAIDTLHPNLLLLHLAMLDEAEHEHGPFSREALAASEVADAQVARVIAQAKKAGIWNAAVLVVLSDHGFASVTTVVRPGTLLHDYDLITLDANKRVTAWKACLISNGGSAYIYVRDASDDATRRALVDLFTPLAGKDGSGIRRVASHDEIVAMGGDPAAFLAIEAPEGTRFTNEYSGKFTEPSTQGGTHGYFPDRPEMRSSLLIYGPSIGHAKIENARLIDIAPSIARWLSLDLPKADGLELKLPLSPPVR